MKLFSFGRKKQIPLDVDVIQRPDVTAYSTYLSKFKTSASDYGAPWYLPGEVKNAMLQDPQVFAAVTIWKMGVLIDGYQITPAVDANDKRYERAKEISDFCNWNAIHMEGSFHMKMLQLLDCCILGHKAASQVYKYQTSGRWKDKAVIDYVRVIPNCDYRIRTDQFNRLLGLQSVREQQDDNIVDKRKFLFCVFRPVDDNPWGTNLLWPVYDPWFQKQKIVPERLAHMAMFGSPSFWVEAPEGMRETDLLDSKNQPVLNDVTGSPVRIPINKAMLTALENFKGNGSATVLPPGSALNMIQAIGKGEVFQKYQEDANSEIIKGILLTTLMTEQAQNQSRASSQTGQVTVQLTIGDGKYMLSDLIQEQFCGNLTKLNWKEKDWDLIPRVSFGNNQTNIASLYNAISALWSVGFFDETQRGVLCRMLGLPEPDPNAPKPQPRQTTGGAVKTPQKDRADGQQNDPNGKDQTDG